MGHFLGHPYVSKIQNLSPADVFFQAPNALQESSAIAKMTAQCALLYGSMGVLKIFDSPWVRPRLRNVKWTFVPMDPVNVRAKFEIRSFTRS